MTAPPDRHAHRWWRSLRIQLAVLGFLVVYVPVLVLLTVTIATEDSDVTSSVVLVDGQEVPQTDVLDETSDAGVRSPWVVGTAIGLAPIAAALAWWLAGRAVRPIEEVRRVAEEIEATDLGRRIELTSGANEIVSLGASFDAMLDRLEDAATTQRRLVEETSHELRTPLSVLVTNADVVLAQDDPTTDDLRAAVERSRSAAARLQATLEGLLVDARGRARTLDRRPCDVVALVHRVVDGARVLAGTRTSTIDVEAKASAVAAVDEELVERAVGNLVENAVHHTPDGTSVSVAVRTIGDDVEVSVTDDGPGIPPADQPRLFDRFWRSGDGAGTGLGVPIAAQIARAHGGDLTVTSPVTDGSGTRVALRLRA